MNNFVKLYSSTHAADWSEPHPSTFIGAYSYVLLLPVVNVHNIWYRNAAEDVHLI